MSGDFFSLSRLLLQMTVQTSDVLPGLPDDWNIPNEGQIYACEDVRFQSINEGEIARAIEGYMWVHLERTTVSLQKGFATLGFAEAAARERARMSGALYVPSDAARSR
jgi:hypothetical protein